MFINQYIDHTILKPTTSLQEVEQVCREAVEHQFAAACIPPFYARIAKTLLQESSVKVATVIGFPFGYAALEAKIAEVVVAMADGVDELDMVINIAALKNNDWNYLEKEIGLIVPLVRSKDKVLKLIIESGILTREEISRCCELYSKYPVQFLKTSTGYAEQGATVEAVSLMRNLLPVHIQIKASGGIRSFEFARQLIAAGATRLGCSASVQIVTQSQASGQAVH